MKSKLKFTLELVNLNPTEHILENRNQNLNNEGLFKVLVRCESYFDGKRSYETEWSG